MRKLFIVSPESFVGGKVECGMAEITDSLAVAFSEQYDVSVICIDQDGFYTKVFDYIQQYTEHTKTGRALQINYYFVQPTQWKTEVIKILNEVKPEIVHNMSEVELVSELAYTPDCTVFTFDSCDILREKEYYLFHYDAITTHSSAFAKEVLKKNDILANTLRRVNFQGVINGILDSILSPDKGLLISAPYTVDDLTGKQACKEKLKRTYGIKGDPFICLVLCRLVPEKGLEKIMETVPVINENGGKLIVVGEGLQKYTDILNERAANGEIIFVNKKAAPQQVVALLAGADFLLQPSVMESGGLMPLTASRYGTIPIITLNGGLSDSFNYTNAIVIDEQTSAAEAVSKAVLLYYSGAIDKTRALCMKQDFSWEVRKKPYINIYEKGREKELG